MGICEGNCHKVIFVPISFKSKFEILKKFDKILVVMWFNEVSVSIGLVSGYAF